MSSSVRVAVRVRPLTAKEELSSCTDCTHFPGTQSVVVGEKTFHFDHVFDTFSQQIQLYDDVVSSLMDRFLEGFNATILAYGQTGSGKTFSMGTGLEVDSSPDQQGIVPRGIHALFQSLTMRKLNSPTTFKFQVFASFLELYNEDLLDLLNPAPKASGDRPRTAGGSATERGWGELSIREDGQGGIMWVGVKEEECRSPDELMRLLQKGSLCRTTGATDMNMTSSRSHAIFSITLKQQTFSPAPQERGTGEGAGGLLKTADSELTIDSNETIDPENSPGTWHRLVSKFHFVDLAGSERLKKTNAVGDRAKEGIAINQGLLALGNVICALSEDKPFVPYRDSKLTRLLQDSLGGNSQTLMLACVSPSDSNYQETINTLRYADRAKNIKNRAIVNAEWVSGAGMKEMERDVKQLRQLVNSLRSELAHIRSGDLLHLGGLAGESGGVIANNVASSFLSTPGLLLYQQQQQQIERTQTQTEAVQRELESLKDEKDATNFEVERLAFMNSKLRIRMQHINTELIHVTTERDVLFVEKAGTDNNENDPQEPAASSENPFMSSASSSSIKPDKLDLTCLDSHPVILNHVRTTNFLKLKLADTEDKLHWYNEMMNKVVGVSAFGGPPVKRNRHTSASSRQVDEKGIHVVMNGIELKPTPKKSWLINGDVQDVFQMDSGVETSHHELARSPAVSTKKLRMEGNDDLDDKCNYDLTENECDNDDDEDDEIGDDVDLEGEEPDAGQEDLYRMLHKIQNDISMKEELVGQLEKSQNEFGIMKEKYEQKLSLIQESLKATQYERDTALKRMKKGSGTLEEKEHGATKIKSKYEMKMKKLGDEIDGLRRKHDDTSRAMAKNKQESENAIRSMKQNIESLKGEKTRLVRQLKAEADRIKQLRSQNEREIDQLKRKEKAAAELAKRLERSNQLQRALLQRRTEQMVTSSKQVRQLKSVMKLLKRTTTPKSISKNNINMSPAKRNRGLHSNSSNTERSSPRLSRAGSANSMREFTPAIPGPPSDIRATFKKQMLDKEIEQCVSGMQLKGMHEDLIMKKGRLIGERDELQAEREKVVASEAQVTGRYDPDAPQYMDDRLDLINEECRLIDSRAQEIRDKLAGMGYANVVQVESLPNSFGYVKKRKGSEATSIDPQDFGVDNAVNLLKSLDAVEMEKVSELLLDDIVRLRMTDKVQSMNIESMDSTILELRQTLLRMKKTAVNAAKEYEKKIADLHAKLGTLEGQSVAAVDVLDGEDMEYVLANEKLMIAEKTGTKWVRGGEIFHRIYEGRYNKSDEVESPSSSQAPSRSNSPIKDLDDGTGGSVAISAWGSTPHSYCNRVMSNALPFVESTSVTDSSRRSNWKHDTLCPIANGAAAILEQSVCTCQQDQNSVLDGLNRPVIQGQQRMVTKKRATNDAQVISALGLSSSAVSLSPEGPPLKTIMGYRYSSMTMGKDVFERLAQTHTVASQLKLAGRGGLGPIIGAVPAGSTANTLPVSSGVSGPAANNPTDILGSFSTRESRDAAI